MKRLRPDAPDHPLRVVIVANYTSDSLATNNRFNDLASRFAARGAQVELVTSRFSHRGKTMRPALTDGAPYTVTHVDEPGYTRNVSFARLRSQSVFASRVSAYLDALEKPPHLLIAAAPPPGVAFECGRYAQRVGTTFAIDIQDIWPEAFTMVAKLPRIAIDLLFAGMRRRTAVAYRQADRIIGVSHTYIDSAVSYGADRGCAYVVYLGTDLRYFDHCAASAGSGALDTPTEADDGELTPTIGYAGGLSASYDLKLVIDALERLAAGPAGRPVPALVVMGDGALREEFEAYAQGKGLQVRFTGNLPYADMARTLAGCQMAVNPIVPGSAGSVLNKAGDYAAAGLPVINSQESLEYRELLERYGAGISCAPSDAEGMAAAIRTLIDDSALRRRMGAGSRRMAVELFDRSVTYEQLVDDLLELASDALARH